MHTIRGIESHELARRLPTEAASGQASLLAVLWARRALMACTIAACVACAGLYLLVATKIYEATAKVSVDQYDPATTGETKGGPAASEDFVQTQADILQSAPVIRHALDAVDFKSTKTFAKAEGDPVVWARTSKTIVVEVAKKTDVLTVTVSSPVAQEAAKLANAVVQSYIDHQAAQKRSTGEQMVAALTQEKQKLAARREEALAAMQKFKAENGIISIGADRGNLAVERTATLSASLTTAEMASIDLRAQLAATQAALANPQSLSAFVEAQQFKSKDTGDREYDDLRSQLVQQNLALSSYDAIQGKMNSHVITLAAVVDSLRRRIAEKERAIASAHLVSLSTALASAEQNEREIRAALLAQRDQIIGLGPKTDQFAKLQAEVDRIQKESELLDNRINEVTVNDVASAPFNIQFVEAATPADRAAKPKKSLVLAVAMMLGMVLGIGLAMSREFAAARLRTPEEIPALLGMQVIATVPPINSRLSPVARGQILHLDPQSPSAEAYRSIRTSLHLGPCREATTYLMASPMSGDGKSTTASNLAIAFAQAGHRTLLIDCDMREPVQHLIFESDGSVGVTSVVAGENKLRDAIRATRVPSLYLLPCGPIPANPSELLASRRFSQLMRALVETFDRIVIDSPPLMQVADARMLAAAADVTLLVLRMNQSMIKYGVTALEGLERVGANVLGAVANDIAPLRDNYYRGSWQYLPAMSARRMMEAVGGRRGETASAAPLSRRDFDETLPINEPDWATEQASADGPADAGPLEPKDDLSSDEARGVNSAGGAKW